MGPSIMKEKIELAIKELKQNKAAEIEHLDGEFLIALEGTGKDVFSSIITEAYEIVVVPEECVMIPILRKKRPKNVKNHKFNITCLEGPNKNMF